MLKSKIHRATITESNLEYEGSISIDTELMEKANLMPYEMVHIYNLSNGERFSTYVIPGTKGQIGLNGAAARKGMKGDLVIITAYCLVPEDKLSEHQPRLVFVDSQNNIIRTKP